MRYLLDTNHADKLLKPNPARQRLEALGAQAIALCRPSVGELWYMVHKSTRVEQNRANLLGLLSNWVVLEFDAPAAEEYGRIMAERSRTGQKIPHVDAQIAGIARSRSLTVLTADKHFQGVAGIRIENWLA